MVVGFDSATLLLTGVYNVPAEDLPLFSSQPRNVLGSRNVR